MYVKPANADGARDSGRDDLRECEPVMRETKRYIGDGVYVDLESGMLKLTTEDGITVSNTIYLEQQVYDQLVAFVDEVEASRSARRSKNKN